MPAPTPSVDISSGNLSNPPIKVGHTFEFTTNATGNIHVSVPAGPGNAWFSGSPAPVVNGSVTVTALLESVGLGWGYTVTGMNVSNNNPHIPVAASK